MARRTVWCLTVVAFLLAAGCDDDTTQAGGDALDLRNQDGSGDTAIGTDGDAPSDGSTDEDTGGADLGEGTVCNPGEFLGCADEHNLNVCREDGSGTDLWLCPNGQNCLGGACTSMVCLPNTQACEGTEQYKLCLPDGSGYGAPSDCSLGSLCQDGQCKTMCEFGKYRSSYIGCEYWTVDLDNYHDPSTNPKPDEVPHSVVISNPSGAPAVVTFNSAAASINVPDPVVPANSAKAFTMPRLDVDGSQISNRSIRILSTTPVAAYQFNPFDDESVFSNGSSLLLPANVLGTDYIVVNVATAPLPCIPGLMCPAPQHAYFTVIATSPGTTSVWVTSTARIAGGDGVDPLAPGAVGTYSLQQGQVLNLQVYDQSLTGPNDPTGTTIHASQPVAAFAGHEEAVIGEVEVGDSCCAEHLEQQLFPVNSWGTSYLAPLSPSRGAKRDMWRIVSSADGITVNTNPPQPGANGVTINRGKFVEFFTSDSFEVTASGPVEVAQFLVSQAQTEAWIGDPEFVLTVPTERFRSDYTLLTPSGYSEDWILVIKPVGAQLMLDGAPLNVTFTPFGTGAWERGEVPVNTGPHTILSQDGTKFGVYSYGFGPAVSYGYPGGLDFVGQSSP